MCGARVWFFRNERGGCAYFDALGAPWAKHPCMDTPFWYSHDAGREARQVHEKAQEKAARKANRLKVAEERRRARAASRGAKATRHGTPVPQVSSAITETVSAVAMPGRRRRWVLGWWTVFSMLLAWLCSLPLTASYYADRGDSPLWVVHWLVGMPTFVSLVALVWFLCTVPTPRPTIGRILVAVLLAPLFLVVGLLTFLFTAGLGSLVFAWLLWRQGTPPAPFAGEHLL